MLLIYKRTKNNIGLFVYPQKLLTSYSPQIVFQHLRPFLVFEASNSCFTTQNLIGIVYHCCYGFPLYLNSRLSFNYLPLNQPAKVHSICQIR